MGYMLIAQGFSVMVVNLGTAGFILVKSARESEKSIKDHFMLEIRRIGGVWRRARQ
jgi:hypothetical protein